MTERDPFGLGEGAYRFESFDAEPELALSDGAHVVYANGAYRGDDELGRLMRDFSCSDPDEMSEGPLADRARHLKRDPEGVGRMCKIVEDMRNEAMEEGRLEGLERGRLETLAGLVRDGLLSLAAAAERAGMSPEQFSDRAASEGYALGL